MYQSAYTVLLKGHTTMIYAFNEQEATILAQAEAIQLGRDYTFISAKRTVQ